MAIELSTGHGHPASGHTPEENYFYSSIHHSPARVGILGASSMSVLEFLDGADLLQVTRVAFVGAKPSEV